MSQPPPLNSSSDEGLRAQDVQGLRAQDVRRNISLLTWFNFFEDFRFYAPVMIIYFETITGSYALAMSVLSIVMLASALFEVPTGIISDLIGRRKTMIAGATASLFAVIMYALADVYAILLIGAVLEGLARALYSGNNEALLHDTLTELDDNQAFQHHLGRTSSAFQFALGMSALLGGIFAAISFNLVMWLSVIPKVLLVWVSLRFVEPQIHSTVSTNAFAHLRQAIQNIIQNRRLQWLTMGRVIILSVGEAMFMLRTVFIDILWPLWAVGIARTISNFSAAASFYFAGALQKRFGERRLLYVGIIGSETLNLFALLIASVISPILMGATSLFFGVNTVSLSGMMQREFSDAQRATMGSLVAFGSSFSFALVSVAFGALADVIGVRDALIVGTLGSLIPVVFFYLAFHHKEPTQITV